MSIIQMNPTVQVNATIKPKKWTLVNLTNFTLAGGQAIGFPLINSFGKDIYINSIRVVTEGGLAVIKLLIDANTIETRTINATTPNVEFDFKEGIILKNGEKIDLDFYSQDTSTQDVSISYMYAEVI